MKFQLFYARTTATQWVTEFAITMGKWSSALTAANFITAGATKEITAQATPPI